MLKLAPDAKHLTTHVCAILCELRAEPSRGTRFADLRLTHLFHLDLSMPSQTRDALPALRGGGSR
jgi:hypothetical protein